MRIVIWLITTILSFHASAQFEIEDLPDDVFYACQDKDGLLAEIGAKWDQTGTSKEKLPKARLVQVCVGSKDMEILCDIAGEKVKRIKVYASSLFVIECRDPIITENVNIKATLTCREKIRYSWHRKKGYQRKPKQEQFNPRCSNMSKIKK